MKIHLEASKIYHTYCLLYTSDAADEWRRVDLGGRRIIKKKFFQAEDGIRDPTESRGLGDVYKRQEGIQCLCKVNEGIGLALKVEDGSKRAKHAVSLHLLKQLEWISDLRIQDIEEKVFDFSEGVRLEVKGKVNFQES